MDPTPLPPGRRLPESEPPRPTAEVLLNCGGFFLGLAVLFWDYLLASGKLSERELEFYRSPRAAVWFFLVAVQFGFWANVTGPIWRRMRRVKRDYGLSFSGSIPLKFGFATLFFAVPFLIQSRLGRPHLLAHQGPKLFLINVAASAVAFVPICGIWYVRAALEAAFGGRVRPGLGKTADRLRVDMVVRLRRDLGHFIAMLGAMIGLGTLARGAFRHAGMLYDGGAHVLPPEYILLHGAYFTGLLALVYFPAHSALTAAGNDLLDSIYRIRSPKVDLKNLADWQKNRKSLEDLLELKSGAMDNLKASVSVLAPLISSLIALAAGYKP